MSATERSRYSAWASGVIAALLIALASALLPGAMPSSQTVGSAFNPATTLVALSRTEAEHGYFMAAPEDGARKNPGHSGSGDLAAAALAGEPNSVRPTRAATAAFARLSARRFVFAHRPGSGPRAPPA